MPRLFKKTITEFWIYDAWIDADGQPCADSTPGARFVKERQVRKGTPGAVRVVKESPTHYGRVNGKPVALHRRRDLAEKKLAELIRKATFAEIGMPLFDDHRNRRLTDHLAEFIADLESRGNAPDYVKTVESRLTALFDGCRFVFARDLAESRARTWLAELRRSGRSGGVPQPLPDQQDEFTRKEVARILGIKPSSVTPLVRRHGLVAHGNGKARRFPRETVEALLGRITPGLSVETSNQYLSHLKAFCNWMVEGDRLPANPFARIEPGNVAVDRRHDRRDLEADELRRLLLATRHSTHVFRGLNGRARYVLYSTACGTGFRASALASLTPAAFDLDSASPVVTLAARQNKSRKTKVQPLPADVAELLRDFMRETMRETAPGQRLWPGTWAKSGAGAAMLRRDLEAAGIPYAVEGPDGLLYADFHALRHTYLTLGGRAGIDLRTLQELAGHSTPDLTARYSHRRLHDLQGAVDKLPSFLPNDAEAEALCQTGTAPTCSPLAARGCTNLGEPRPIRLRRDDGPQTATGPNALPLQEVGTGLDRLGPFERERAIGFEPTTSSLGRCQPQKQERSHETTSDAANTPLAQALPLSATPDIDERLADAWAALTPELRELFLRAMEDRQADRAEQHQQGAQRPPRRHAPSSAKPRPLRKADGF
jgi:excisionase family DNA binding protein